MELITAALDKITACKSYNAQCWYHYVYIHNKYYQYQSVPNRRKLGCLFSYFSLQQGYKSKLWITELFRGIHGWTPLTRYQKCGNRLHAMASLCTTTASLLPYPYYSWQLCIILMQKHTIRIYCIAYNWITTVNNKITKLSLVNLGNEQPTIIKHGCYGSQYRFVTGIAFAN